MRIINVVCVVISLLVFVGGMIVLGIRCLKLHDDALLHPPDQDPDHTQWPEEDDL